MRNLYFKRTIVSNIFLASLLCCSFYFLPKVFAGATFGTYLGQYSTVAVNSNGISSHVSGDNNYMNHYIHGNNIYIGMKWQCVEYIRRYYATIFNLDLASLWRGDAEDWYSNASTMNLDKYENGVTTTAPQVGDILTSNVSPNGHVAIIKSIQKDKLYTVQQNVSNTAADASMPLTLSVANGKYTISGFSNIQGWLRRKCQQGQSQAKWHPDGSLLLDERGTAWLIENGKRRGIPDELTFVTHGFSWCNLIKTTSQELSCIPEDSPLGPLPEIRLKRRLVKRPDGTVFLITDRGFRRAFTSSTVFEGLGYSWSEVINLSNAEIDQYLDDTPASRFLTSPFPDGTLIQEVANGAVYVITNGKKRGISSGTVFHKLGYTFDKVILISPALFGTIESGGEPIDDHTVDTCGVITPNPVGSVSVNATLDGHPWAGSVNYNVVGPQGVVIGNGVPATTHNLAVGQHRLVFYSGGPDALASITPSETQYVSGGNTITFTLNFGGRGGGEESPSSFSSSASVNPGRPTNNQNVTITTNITNSGGAVTDVIVDTEIYNSAGQKVFQSVFDHKDFSANQTQAYTSTCPPVADGLYTVKIGVFNNNWTVNYHWNDNAQSFSVDGGAPPPPPSSNYQVQIWWPTNGATVSGIVPFKAMLTNMPVSQYVMYWQVDDGQLNLMPDNFQDYPHKEYSADVSGWNWRGNGPYNINFVAKDLSGNVIAQTATNIYINR